MYRKTPLIIILLMLFTNCQKQTDIQPKEFQRPNLQECNRADENELYLDDDKYSIGFSEILFPAKDSTGTYILLNLRSYSNSELTIQLKLKGEKLKETYALNNLDWGNPDCEVDYKITFGKNASSLDLRAKYGAIYVSTHFGIVYLEHCDIEFEEIDDPSKTYSVASRYPTFRN